MTKTINDFLSPDDLMLAGPAENAPSDYWSKPAIEGDGNQKQRRIKKYYQKEKGNISRPNDRSAKVCCR